jgi:alkylhydroperoxidase family enzyme
VDRFAEDWRSAGLGEDMLALLDYTEKLTRTPAACDQSDVDHLRSLRWSDRAIHDAVQVCSYFNYINRIAEGLGVDDEAWLDAMGRPR